MNDKANKLYKTASTETASPGKLILMLYDGALRFMKLAKAGFDVKVNHESNEVVNNNVFRAQQIVAELRGSLDMSVEGDFPRRMGELYDYIQDCLFKANVEKDPVHLDNAYKYLKEIRDAWAEMLGKKDLTNSDIATTSLSCSA